MASDRIKKRLNILLGKLPSLEYSQTLDLNELLLLLEALVNDGELVAALRKFETGGGSIRISDTKSRQFPFLDIDKLTIPYGLPITSEDMCARLRKLLGLS